MTIRTYGLSGSGIDVDQMVKDLMKARRTSYDQVWQKKTQLEWKKADYNTMYTTLRDFRNTTAFNYKLQSTLLPKKVTSSDETKVVVSANADAANVSHSLTVTQLAEGVTETSSGAISLEGTSKVSLVSQFGMDSTAFDIKITNGSLSKTIAVDPTKSIYELVSSINNAGINVKANYDANLDRFFLYTTGTGQDVGIDFTGSSAEGMSFLTDTLKLPAAPRQGKNAEFTLDGADLTKSSNTFTISGVTYNLKTEGSVNIAVTPDNDKSAATVKAFIESYNALLEKINGELKETKYKDFMPLTDAQKSEMEESQIKAWEEKARSGLLRRDPILQDLVTKMRMDVSTPVSGLSGKYTNLASIGITTGDYSEGGKLYLNETELKKALDEDPDIVYKLFGTSGDSGNFQGVAVRLYDTLKNGMDKIYNQAGITAALDGDTESYLSKLITNYNEQLHNMNWRLQEMEDRYYAQFDAMEVALNKLSQQSSWLLQQFSSN